MEHGTSRCKRSAKSIFVSFGPYKVFDIGQITWNWLVFTGERCLNDLAVEFASTLFGLYFLCIFKGINFTYCETFYGSMKFYTNIAE